MNSAHDSTVICMAKSSKRAPFFLPTPDSNSLAPTRAICRSEKPNNPRNYQIKLRSIPEISQYYPYSG